MAVSGTPKMEYINIFKNIFKWQAVNETQATYYKKTNPDPKCPCVRTQLRPKTMPINTNTPLARKAQKAALNKLKSWCKKHKMHPRIISSILRNFNLEHIEHKRISEAIRPSTPDTFKIGELISRVKTEQEDIGWGHFLFGRLSKK